MKYLLTTLFLVICCGGIHAQTAIDQESIISATQQETNLFQPKTDSLQQLLTVNNLAQNREDQRLRARLSYPKMLDGLTSSVKPQSESYTLAEPQPDASSNYFKPLQDMSWVGVPIFVAGIIAKGEKEAFRQDYKNSPARTRLVTEFKTRIDDYLQFFSPAMTLGLKVGGVKGRSDWQRLGVSAAMSYGIMAGFVNGIKYTATEMRPDGSTANSWPSGHTATAFVGATILHKEYGLTKSPWYSVVGYGAATATGIMRVLNNRHWVSDVLSGAGIGIMSGELGYFLSDVIYKGRHLLNSPRNSYPDLSRKHPSFFDVSMGIGFGSKELVFPAEKLMLIESVDNIKLQFRSATAVQAEGAYFLNTYVGVGGRLRVRSSPINGWSKFMKTSEAEIQEITEGLKDLETEAKETPDIVIDGKITDMIEEKEISIKSDHLTEFAGDVGLYFNFPLNNRLALGSKLLIGRSVMQALEIDARFKGQTKGFDFDASVRNGELSSVDNMRFYDKNESYDEEWALVTVSGNNSTKWGTGISLTYAYNGNFCWKVFCDYDFTKKTYTLEYNPDHYTYKACPDLILFSNMLGIGTEPIVVKTKKNMSQFVLGASFSIQF